MPGAFSPHRICFFKTHSAPTFHWTSPISLLHSTIEEIRSQEGTGWRPPAGWVGGEVREVTKAPSPPRLAPMAHMVRGCRVAQGWGKSAPSAKA